METFLPPLPAVQVLQGQLFQTDNLGCYLCNFPVEFKNVAAM